MNFESFRERSALRRESKHAGRHMETTQRMKRRCKIFTMIALAGFIAFSIERTMEVLAAGSPGSPVEQAGDGSVTLAAKDAKINGPNARIEKSEVESIAWWTSVDTSLHWIAKIKKAGKYRVELNFSVLGNRERSPLYIAVGDQTTKAVLTPCNGINDFKWGQAGEITISKAGNIPVTVKTVSKAQEFVMYLRSIALRPADSPGKAIDITGRPIEADEGGAFKLTAADAEIDGMSAQLEGDDEKNIGFWRDVGTSLAWAIHDSKPGSYRVELNYSLAEGYDGSKVAIIVGDQSVTAKPKAGGEWTDYKTGDAGEITISKPGNLQVVAKPLSKPWGFIMNLRSVTLRPGETRGRAADISDQPVKQAHDGSLELTSTEAEMDGLAARLEGGETKCIAWWNSPERFIKWPVHVNKPGIYDVLLSYSMERNAHSKLEIDVGQQKITVTLQSSGDLDAFKTEKVGEAKIDGAGNFDVVLKSPEEFGHHVMNVRSVELIPVQP